MKKKKPKIEPALRTIPKVVVIKKSSNQAGASLIELLIAAAIGLMIMVAGLYVLNARIRVTRQVETSKEAEFAGESGLTALTASFGTINDGGSFTETGKNLTLQTCSPEFCDYILNQDDSSLNNSPAKGVPYGSTIPDGNSVAFVRRWRVETVSNDYKLKKITIAVMKDEQQTKPDLLLKTVVSSSNPE